MKHLITLFVLALMMFAAVAACTPVHCGINSEAAWDVHDHDYDNGNKYLPNGTETCHIDGRYPHTSHDKDKP